MTLGSGVPATGSVPEALLRGARSGTSAILHTNDCLNERQRNKM